MTLDDYLSIEQARHFILNVKTGELGISRARVQQLITAGKLPATMKAGRWFIERADLVAFLEKERHEGRPKSQS